MKLLKKSIIPALKRNYDTVLSWQNNTGDLFVVLDAWEALNMAQLDKLDKLNAILSTQVAIENNWKITMNKYVKYSLVVVGFP
jgi:hypothetical protein